MIVRRGDQLFQGAHNMSGSGKGSVASLLALALYMASSSALIILNKQLMVDDGFRFPLFLTAAGQVASVVLGEIRYLCCHGFPDYVCTTAVPPILKHGTSSTQLSLWSSESGKGHFSLHSTLTCSHLTRLKHTGLLLARQGSMPLKAMPTFRFYVTRLLPLVACTAGTLFFGNICYLYLSVSSSYKSAMMQV